MLEEIIKQLSKKEITRYRKKKNLKKVTRSSYRCLRVRERPM